ncbi:resistance to Congo red protein [Kineosporia succinea]|uniref:Uncharacterized protein n=1 Tax=Kineosporia succinea TaxID=84632 RepID=A0ABT9PB68_9ACTN|nr:resistance to Congo red protein [Kineosporia succinea]MDP9829941.1 hypothetical protein [Kineosporia succinea]
MRFNPPPNWPVPPQGWSPDAGWSPDPSWPAPPENWPLWLPDGSGPADELSARLSAAFRRQKYERRTMLVFFWCGVVMLPGQAVMSLGADDRVEAVFFWGFGVLASLVLLGMSLRDYLRLRRAGQRPVRVLGWVAGSTSLALAVTVLLGAGALLVYAPVPWFVEGEEEGSGCWRDYDENSADDWVRVVEVSCETEHDYVTSATVASEDLCPQDYELVVETDDERVACLSPVTGDV